MSAKRTKAPRSKKQTASEHTLEAIEPPEFIGPPEQIEVVGSPDFDPPADLANEPWRPLMDALAWMRCKDQGAVDRLVTTTGAVFKFSKLFDTLPGGPGGHVRDPAHAWQMLRQLVSGGAVAIRGRWVERRQIVVDGLAAWDTTADANDRDVVPATVARYRLRDDADAGAKLSLTPNGAAGRHLEEITVNWAQLVAATSAESAPVATIDADMRETVAASATAVANAKSTCAAETLLRLVQTANQFVAQCCAEAARIDVRRS